jgi:4-oxalocrotonate tautomerase
MPMVQITMLHGRTAEQKRKIAKRITDALVEEAGARREGIIAAFHEVSKESYALGGELMADKESDRSREKLVVNDAPPSW